MKRPFVLVLAALCCAAALAQGDPAPLPVPLDAQVQVLRLARALKLRQDQLDQLKPVLEQVKVAREQLKAAQDALWAKSQDDLGEVDRAMVAGNKPPRNAVAAVDRTAAANRAALGVFDRAVDAAVVAALKVLDKPQAGLVETRQQRAARTEATGHFGGCASLSEYLAAYMVAMRKLLPDEYENLRVAMSLRLAEELLPANDRRYNSAVADVVRIMDTVRRMSDADFADREADLPAAVGRSLGLREAGGGRLGDPLRRLRELRARRQDAGGAGDLQAGAGPGGKAMRRYAFPLLIALALVAAGAAGAADDRHPLAAALDYDANLLLLSDLQPSSRQLLELLNSSRAVARLVEQYEQGHRAALDKGAALLKAAGAALAAGTPLPEEQAVALADYRTAEQARKDALQSAVGEQIRRLRGSLSAAQGGLVNWDRPADLPAKADDAARLEEMRLLAARLGEASRFIERLRYLIVSDYSITRIGRVEDYLKGHVRPGTPEFSEARDFTMHLLDEARVVNEADWPGQTPLFASRLLQHLGLLDQAEPARQGRDDARYNWWDVYYLLTDAQTPRMLQAVIAARGNAADAPDQGDAKNDANQ